MSLQRFTLSPLSRPIDFLADMRRGGRDTIDLTASYQRESVWDLEKRRSLVKSILLGLPIGAVFLNRRSWKTPVVFCVDGKRRWVVERGQRYFFSGGTVASYETELDGPLKL